MKKLKDILLEKYAWERKPGKGLPTLAEVQAEYEKNEAADPLKAKIAKLEKEIADIKHQYYSDANLTAEKSQRLRKQWGEKDRELKRAKREDRTGSPGYNPSPERRKPTSPSSKPQPRWQDSDGDGTWYEPGDDVKESIKEAHDDSGILDLVEKAENMVQNLRRNMATNSVLRRDEKMGYLQAYDELLDVLSDIGFEAERD